MILHLTNRTTPRSTYLLQASKRCSPGPRCSRKSFRRRSIPASYTLGMYVLRRWLRTRRAYFKVVPGTQARALALPSLEIPNTHPPSIPHALRPSPQPCNGRQQAEAEQYLLQCEPPGYHSVNARRPAQHWLRVGLVHRRRHRGKLLWLWFSYRRAAPACAVLAALGTHHGPWHC